MATLDAMAAGDAGALIAGPSRRAGWRVARLLGHLAASAESQRRALAAAAEGRSEARYPGGAAQREQETAAAAALPAAELIDRVRTTAGALEAAWDAMPAVAWTVVSMTTTGVAEAMSGLPFARWRQVELHHVDLGLGFGHDDWPADYVRIELGNAVLAWRASHSMGLTELPPAALALPPARRLAWLCGRLDVEGLAPAPGWL